MHSQTPAESGQIACMSAQLHTVPVSLVHSSLAGARERRGISAAQVVAILEACGISPSVLTDPEARITPKQYGTLLRKLIQVLDDECIGFLSHPMRPGSFALVIRSTLGAPSLAVAMCRAAHTFRLLQHGVALHYAREDGLAGFTLQFADADVAGLHIAHDVLMRVFWHMLAWLSGGRLPPRRVDFSYASPQHGAFHAIMFPTQVQFGRSRSAVWFDAAALDAPVRRDEVALRKLIRNAPENFVVPRPSDYATRAQVGAVLRQSEPEWPDMEAVARRLYMSISTLQRRLATEGITFQTLKDQLRRDLAIERLSSSSTPIAEVAAQLGFADTTAFNRAFKVWTGTTPGSYRRRG